jgi:hypothetical protein
MKRFLSCLTLLAVIACNADNGTKPRAVPAPPPAFAISDRARPGGNPNFFFLLPLQLNTRNSPNWTVGGFNPRLSPQVVICRVTATTGQPPILVQFNAGTECQGGVTLATLPAALAPGANQVPDDFKAYLAVYTPAAAGFLRINVLVGARRLGFIDVQVVTSASQLRSVDRDNFAPYLAGLPLPILFRVEKGATCTGTAACAEQVVQFATGGTVSIELPNSTGASGVTIPPQGNNVTTTVTVESCPDLNPRATDLPTFGSCIRVTANPPLAPGSLPNFATVQICDLAAVHPNVASEEQEHRITLHQFDAPGTLKALPHAAGCSVPTTGALKTLWRDLARGDLKSAGRQLVSALAPKPLYASMFLDQGGGGSAADFSDFQFALPAKMEKVSGDNQTGLQGAPLAGHPTVRITDLGGEPVRGAKVTFGTAAGNGSVLQTTFLTGTSGVLDALWTLPATTGVKSLTASGRGIAGADNNGPRAGVDPFQPIQPFFDPAATPSGAVTVLTGSVTFNATSSFEPVASGFFDFGSGGYSSKVIPSSGVPPAGWQLVSFDPFATGFTVGATAPFGDAATATCANYLGAGTSWGVNTDLLVRKQFSLATGGPVTIRAAIDNDLVEVWLNGVLLNPAPITHEGCAFPNEGDNALLYGTGVAGTNIIAIRARDRGIATFLDIKVFAGGP